MPYRLVDVCSCVDNFDALHPFINIVSKNKVPDSMEIWSPSTSFHLMSQLLMIKLIEIGIIAIHPSGQSLPAINQIWNLIVVLFKRFDCYRLFSFECYVPMSLVSVLVTIAADKLQQLDPFMYWFFGEIILYVYYVCWERFGFACAIQKKICFKKFRYASILVGEFSLL